MLEADKNEAKLLHQSIGTWKEQGLIDEDQALRLAQSIRVKNADRRLIVVYIFIAAVSCALMAFGSLVLDEKWIEQLRVKLSLTDAAIAVFFALLSAFLFYWGNRSTAVSKKASFSREAFWVLPVLSVGVMLVYIGKSTGYLDKEDGVFFLAAWIIFGATALWTESRLLWMASLACFLIGIIRETYIGKEAGHFPWLNIPCQMFVLGLLILLLAKYAKKPPSLSRMDSLNRVSGWVLLLFSGWLISIFGNTSGWTEWQAVRQIHFIYWALLFTLFLVAVIWAGIRRKDELLRDMGIVGMLLNLYTRYFEYLWDRTHKGIFFAILAISLWFVGRKIEHWKEKKPVSSEGNR